MGARILVFAFRRAQSLEISGLCDVTEANLQTGLALYDVDVVECDQCGKVRMVNEVHAPRRDMPIREILKRMRHDGCGGQAGKVELLTGIEGVSSRPVRRIALMD